MVNLKSEEEVEVIKEGAIILGKVHGEIAKMIVPGMKTADIDRMAEQFILDHGGRPSFKGYNGFPFALCISINQQVVHGFPSEYELRERDIVSIDCGVYYNNYHSDSAYTYGVGKISDDNNKLLEVTEASLYKGIEQAKHGRRLGDISAAIQNCAEEEGFTIVRELVGHGIGRDLHEEPQVPNYGRRGNGPKLRAGTVIAIEPMVNLGKRHVIQEDDGWTISTRDGKVSAHFEHTVAIFEDRTEVITTHDYIKEALSLKERNGQASVN